MTTEQKAKAYDEAIKVAKRNYETIVQMDDDCTFAKEGIVNTFLHIFPELKESEDEKIKEDLIQWINEFPDIIWRGHYKKDVIAWLEKQGEQKTTDKVIEEEKPLLEKFKQAVYDCAWGKVTCKKEGETKEEYANRWAEQFLLMVRDWADDYIDFTIQQKLRNGYEKGKTDIIEKLDEQNTVETVAPKFKVGDWVVDNNSGGVYQVTEIRDDEYCLWPIDAEIMGYLRIIDVDNDYHLWTIEDAKDGDVLYFNDNTIVIFKDLYNATTFHSYCHIEDGVFDISQDDMPDWWECKGFYPATKEQRDTLMKAMADAGYTFDFEKKKLKKIEQKTTWSEEDEVGLGDALWAIEQARTIAKDENDMGNLWYAERWLKALKDRVKPQQKQEWSEEDEHMFDTIANSLNREQVEHVWNTTEEEVDNWLKSIKDRYAFS